MNTKRTITSLLLCGVLASSLHAAPPAPGTATGGTVARDGTGLTNPSNWRTALSLVPGSHVQAYDAGLTALAGGSDYVQLTGATGTIKVYTLPNANATLARTDAAQTFTGTQTFLGNVVSDLNFSTVSGSFTTTNGNITASSGTVSGDTLRAPNIDIQSTGSANRLTLTTSEALSANRTLGWNVGNTSRTITLSGNPTLGDWFDQSVKSGASPTFSGTNITALNGSNISTGNIAVARIATALTTPGAIGGTTPAAGAFTTLTASGQTELASSQAASTDNSAMTVAMDSDRMISPSNIFIREEFLGGYVSATATLGEIGWSSYYPSGSVNTPVGTAPNIGAVRLTTGASSNNGAVIYFSYGMNPLASTNWEFCYTFGLTQTSACDAIIGFTADNSAVGIGNYGGTSFGVRYSTGAGDTNFMFFSKKTNSDWAGNDANNYSLSSGVAADTNYHTFRMRSSSVGAVQMKIDGGAWTSVTMVSSSGNFFPFFYVSTRTTAAKILTCDFWSYKQTGLSR